MKYRRIAALFLSGLTLAGYAQQISPLSKAMLDGYSAVLAQDPKDYQTLFDRASQYYSLSLYDKALLDISKAIQYTPAKEQALLAREYSLLADIRIEEKEYAKALDAIDKALGYMPDSYIDIYKRGNICLHLNKPEDAYTAFSRMQRFKSRSQEAYFGMAKARILQGNLAEAKELMAEAEKADPGNWLTYCRLGDLSRDMKDNVNAAKNYILAFATAENSSRPMESLLSIGEEDYASVSKAFDNAIAQTQNTLPLYFLKANIAKRAGAFNEAEESFKMLLNTPDGRQPGVWAAYGETLLALDRKEEAIEAIEKAIETAPTVSNFSLLSNCLLAAGEPQKAALTALKAYSADEHAPEAMKALAEAQIASGNPNEAIKILNDLIMENPEDVYAIALRANVKDMALGDLQGAKTDYQRVANFVPKTPEETVIAAYGKLKTGKTFDADNLAESLAGNADKDTAYLLASYYATAGNLDKAKNWLDKAKGQGYSNLYNLNSNTVSLLNVSALR